jgi:hypothetical protein
MSKKIYNPITGKYYEIKKRKPTKKLENVELWKPPKKIRKKSIWDLILR